MADDPVLAAEVVLRPPGGDVGGTDQITAERLAAFTPDEQAARLAADYFSRHGFTVSPLRGISFTIGGPRSLVEREFGTAVRVGGVPGAAVVTVGAGGLELPLDRLPADVAAAVQAVTFTPPPDYGPTHP